jgi:hypothetical protein
MYVIKVLNNKCKMGGGDLVVKNNDLLTFPRTLTPVKYKLKRKIIWRQYTIIFSLGTLNCMDVVYCTSMQFRFNFDNSTCTVNV